MLTGFTHKLTHQLVHIDYVWYKRADTVFTMPINGHGQNMMNVGSNGLLNVCVNNSNNGNNSAKVGVASDFNEVHYDKQIAFSD